MAFDAVDDDGLVIELTVVFYVAILGIEGCPDDYFCLVQMGSFPRIGR